MNRLWIVLLMSLMGCRGHDHSSYSESSPPLVSVVSPAKSVLFYGSDLGTIVRRCYQNNDFQNILSFISDSSVKTYGRKRLEYSIMKDSSLANSIKLKSVIWDSDSSRCTLTYQVNVMATSYVKHLEVVYENDTPKVILSRAGRVFQ